MTEISRALRDELLTLLDEEAAEVIQASCKVQRFGADVDHPGYGNNLAKLAGELGDLIGIVDALGILDGSNPRCMHAFQMARATKIQRVVRAGGFPDGRPPETMPAPIIGGGVSLRETVRTLREAEEDGRVTRDNPPPDRPKRIG